MLQGMIPFAHEILTKSVQMGETVVDATCGNGNDTVFLSELVGDKGHVYAFDVQEQAIETTKKRLAEHSYNNVTYILDSHANVDQYIELKERIAGAVFNLGYLPRSDKQVITQPTSTITAIKKLLSLLRQHGLLVLVIYAGHEGGREEKEAVIDYVSKLDQKQYAVLQYQYLNLKNTPPFVVAIEKK